MEYEKVIDKVRKLQALVEGGADGEIKAARRALEHLCRSYDVNLEELFSEKVQRWAFTVPYHDLFARTILFQIYAKVVNSPTIEFSHNRNMNVFYFDLTNSQYVEMQGMFDFFFPQWKKEKKQLLEDLVSAFLNKHNLFSDQAGLKEEPMTPERWQKILRTEALMSQLKDVSYHKQLK